MKLFDYIVYFCRAMLSAAHVLAMDAKNLLDVVDSIRMRYPDVNALICSPLPKADQPLPSVS